MCYRSVEHIGGISMKRLNKTESKHGKILRHDLNSILLYQVRGAFLYTLGGGAL